MNDIYEMIDTAARQVYWHYSKYVELDDLMQEGWLAYIAKRRKYDRLLVDPLQVKYVKYSIRKACASYARREMWERLQVVPEDQYRYSKPEINLLVEMFVSGEWDDGRLRDERIDLERGWGQLNTADRRALEYRHGPRDTKLTSADRMRASRAIRRLQGLMCARHEDVDWVPPGGEPADICYSDGAS